MDIKTIFFDIGSTLRLTEKTPEILAEGRRKLALTAGSTEDPEVFYAKLKARYDVYREKSKSALLDYPEIELWTQVMLPDVDGEFVAPRVTELTTLWRDGTNGLRITRFDAVETVKELYHRGYKLGIIANTITEAEIPNWTIEEGISHCFTTSILSSKVRLRKPDPAIYHLASRCSETPEINCAYIGDNPDRDVEGTRAAGYGCMVLIDDPEKYPNESLREHCDYLIKDLTDLLLLFPAKS